MANKIVKIPLKYVQGLQSNGSYKLRYRIKSKDGSRNSEWSEIATISYPPNSIGEISSFYEIYLPSASLFGRPTLDDGSGGDPHPASSYLVANVSTAIDADKYIKSAISYLEDDTELYTYKWTMPPTVPVNQTFDVYLSWKSTTAWSDWEYAGTTDSNSFSFFKPSSDKQYVQAAVFLSSNPKLTNIFGEEAEITFVSIAKTYSTYQDVGASTLSVVTTPSAGSGGKYYGTISGLAVAVPADIVGRRVFSDTATFDSKMITVKSRTSNTITVESSTAFGSSSTTTSLSNIRL